MKAICHVKRKKCLEEDETGGKKSFGHQDRELKRCNEIADVRRGTSERYDCNPPGVFVL
jgi:hypothetical protein